MLLSPVCDDVGLRVDDDDDDDDDDEVSSKL